MHTVITDLRDAPDLMEEEEMEEYLTSWKKKKQKKTLASWQKKETENNCGIQDDGDNKYFLQEEEWVKSLDMFEDEENMQTEGAAVEDEQSSVTSCS